MNTINHIPTIWLTGLHRSGKWTEIVLLTNFLLTTTCTPIIRKGHGTRQGLGDDPRDPEDLRWQNYYLQLKDQSLPNSQALREEAARKLQRELSTTYRDLQTSPVQKPLIILDRTLVDRYLTEKRYNPQADFTSVRSFPSETNTQKIQQTIIPDLIFILDCKLKTLLGRMKPNEVKTPAWIFKLNNVMGAYPLFDEIIHNLPQDIQEHTHIINGNLAPDLVHQEIEKIVIQTFPQYFQK